MKTSHKQTAGELLAKKIHSKIDHSGTDPNRYGSYYSSDDAAKLENSGKSQRQPSLIPGIDANVGTVERILMIAGGTFLLYNGLSGNKKSIAKTLTGGAMLMRGISGYCPAYDAMSDNGGKMKAQNVNIRTQVTINRPVTEVYSFWRKLENLPRFMSHLQKVSEIDNMTSEWTAKGPAGIGQVSWKAQILMDESNKILSWHSLPESTIDNAGKVRFTDNGDSTDLDVTISYHAPLGIAGEAAAKWLNPMFERMVKKDIESLKDYLESGQDKSDI